MELNALWAKVMKGIYFYDKDLFNACKLGRACWAWSSLIVGRDFLKEHILWQIIEGESVSIWEDKWILGMECKKLRHPGLVDSQILEKLAKLMDRGTEDWNLDHVDSGFLRRNVKLLKEYLSVNKEDVIL